MICTSFVEFREKYLCGQELAVDKQNTCSYNKVTNYTRGVNK